MKYPITRIIKGGRLSPLKFKVYNKFIFDEDKNVGRCWPYTKKHIIEIDPRQCPRDYMDTLIHEALHELFPKKSETVIAKSGTSIANLLWRLKYRKQK